MGAHAQIGRSMDKMRFGLRPENHWNVVCLAPDGTVKWTEDFDNLVTVTGRAKALNGALGNHGSTTWYVGFKSSGDASTDDTLNSHATWTEVRPYAGNRPLFTHTTASSGEISNTGNVAAFTINASTNILGAFLANEITGSSAGAILYGVGNFAAERTVASGDTVNVTITATLTTTT